MAEGKKRKRTKGIIAAVTAALIVGLAGVSFAAWNNGHNGHGFAKFGHGGMSRGCGMFQNFTGSSAN